MLDEGKAYAVAEARLLEVRIKAGIGKYQRAAIIIAAAVAFALAGLIALAVTLVIGLARAIGPWGGGLLAVAVFAAIAGGLAFAAKRLVERIDD